MQILLKSNGSVENVQNYTPTSNGTVILEINNKFENHPTVKIVKDWEVEVID